MSEIEVSEYVAADGSNHYRKWFDKLDVSIARKVETAIVRLSNGNTSNVKWFDGIGEYKINWGPGYRIYLAKDGEHIIVLFGGGTKKRQSSDIKKAIELHKEYKRRKQNAN
jgi:putative addiction module killer protein